jgi:membrane protein
MAAGDIFAMLKEAFKDWNEDNAPRLGAALSYYTIFSISPLLLISIALAGLVFGHDAARAASCPDAGTLRPAARPRPSRAWSRAPASPCPASWRPCSATVTLLFGAGGAFNELRAALDVIWEIPPRKSGGLMAIIHDRLASFGWVLVVGFLLSSRSYSAPGSRPSK